MKDYCFPEVTVEELADKLPQLLGCYPHQISSAARLKCRTLATALKTLPRHDLRAQMIEPAFRRSRSQYRLHNHVGPGTFR